MLRKAFLLLLVLFLIPCVSYAEIIDVHIKGVDDGVKTTKQQDYKEAVLFAKREAIERAGVKVKALTTAKDFVIHSDYIESKAEAVLLPGYNVVDMGYSASGEYQVVLVGKVKPLAKSGKGFKIKDLCFEQLRWYMTFDETYTKLKRQKEIMENSGYRVALGYRDELGLHQEISETEPHRKAQGKFPSLVLYHTSYPYSEQNPYPALKEYRLKFVNNFLQEISLNLRIEDEGYDGSLTEYYLGSKKEFMEYEFNEYEKNFLLSYGQPAYNTEMQKAWSTPSSNIEITNLSIKINIKYTPKD